jgi:ABC-2 type transport system ATP-binding protein
MTEGTTPIIEVQGLTRRFRRKVALDRVSLKVTRGQVFGLVGENGAGKTTLIKLLLGMLRPNEGTVRVFGADPIADPVGVLSRIGYLSEDRDLPGWMRVDELMRYTKAFYQGWDDAYAEDLRQTMNLDAQSKVRTLSRGEKAKAGLMVALAYRPDLLLLDEPSSGLDAVVRRHILSAIIRTVADEGRTVLFSSHLLDEVERVADHVAMISGGQIVLCAPMDEIKANHHRLTLRFADAQLRAPSLAGALNCEGSGREWTAVCDGRLEDLKAAALKLNAEIVEESAATLEEIFVARVAYRTRLAATARPVREG